MKPLSALEVRQSAIVPRLAVVLSHPTQYYSPWFRWLVANEHLELRVFYLWNFGIATRRDPKFEVSFRWDTDLLSGYEHEFVPNIAHDPGTHHFGGLRNPSLVTRLSLWQPRAVLVFGYKWVSHVRVIAWARLQGIPLLFRGDSHFIGRERPPLLQRLLLRMLYRQFAAFLPVGAANRDYFTTLGVPQRRLFFAPHAVDDTLFNLNRADHQATAGLLRAQLGLTSDQMVVLFAGKLVPEKQPRALLEAFVAISRPRTALVFVGDGPEKPALQEIAGSRPDATVHFLPFANQSEMPAHLLLADLFVLPSRGHYETWGLVINEAMHMGVPCLVSDLVGCQRDLVTDGETGWVFRTDQPGALRLKLETALEDLARPGRRAELRTNVLTRISNYTYTQTTAGLMTALESLGPP